MKQRSITVLSPQWSVTVLLQCAQLKFVKIFLAQTGFVDFPFKILGFSFSILSRRKNFFEF